MKSHAEHWDQEYLANSPHFKGLASTTPSNVAIKFVDYLKKSGKSLQGDLLEAGCGMGRNCIWLTKQGFNVTGIDISSVAIKEAKRRTLELNLNINFQTLDISKPWPFEENSIDYILDITTSHLLTLDELERYKKEVLRVLKPGGTFAIYTLDRTVDQESQKLLQESPGDEPNTYIIPEMNHQERTFTLEEITDLFSPLKCLESELIHKPTRFEDKVYDRYYWWVIFEK